MSYHSFSLDPRTVLGVSPDASLDEIREAYRAKSKKHHPDVGGDEWAFQMVTRAYEVLKTTAALRSSQPWDTSVAAGGEKGHAPDWSKVWAQPFRSAGATSKSPGDFHETTSAGDTVSDVDCDDQPETVAQEAVSSRPEPDRFRAVDVELIWTRFEKDRSGTLLTTQEGDDATLSVCMVISWPPHELVDDAADFNSTGDRLRAVIDSFEHMRPLNGVIASRSRIEDGRFVGWLSYLDVPTAQDAFLALRNTFAAQGLTVKLYTRDERIPLDWYGTSHQPVMSQAS